MWCGVFSGRVGTLWIRVGNEIDEAYRWRKRGEGEEVEEEGGGGEGGRSNCFGMRD